MTRSRKKWRLTYTGSAAEDHFTSEKKTYEFVQSLARAKAAGDPIADRATVWVDEGRGWQRFEVLDMVELAAAVAR